MVETDESSASPGGRGRGRGRGGGKLAASASSSGPAAAGQLSSGPSEAEVPWARLLSQCSRTPHFPIIDKEISVGRGELRDICLGDKTFSRTLCRLRHLEQGGPCELEVTGENGLVYVNGRRISIGSKVPLVGGDEVVFGIYGKNAYIFQHPLGDKVTKAVPISTLALSENPMTNVKSIDIENRAGYSSIDAEATILATVPNHSGDQIAVPAASAEENNHIVVESALENQRDRIRFLNPSATLSPRLSGRQTFRDVLKQGILSPDEIDVTLDNFPYYLSANTKNILLSSALIHMEKEFTNRFPHILSVNQRILLSGPSGSEIYQETLIKALAKHFTARFLVVDYLMLCGRPPKVQDSVQNVKRNYAPTSIGTSLLRPASLPKQHSTKAKSNKNIFREGFGAPFIFVLYNNCSGIILLHVFAGDRVEYIGFGSLRFMQMHLF